VALTERRRDGSLSYELVEASGAARDQRAAAGDELKLHTECAAKLGDELAKVEKAKASRYLCRNPMRR
jgi:hypothetical protein